MGDFLASNLKAIDVILCNWALFWLGFGRCSLFVYALSLGGCSHHCSVVDIAVLWSLTENTLKMIILGVLTSHPKCFPVSVVKGVFMLKYGFRQGMLNFFPLPFSILKISGMIYVVLGLQNSHIQIQMTFIDLSLCSKLCARCFMLAFSFSL